MLKIIMPKKRKLFFFFDRRQYGTNLLGNFVNSTKRKFLNRCFEGCSNLASASFAGGLVGSYCASNFSGPNRPLTSLTICYCKFRIFFRESLLNNATAPPGSFNRKSIIRGPIKALSDVCKIYFSANPRLARVYVLPWRYTPCSQPFCGRSVSVHRNFPFHGYSAPATDRARESNFHYFSYASLFLLLSLNATEVHLF